MDNAQSVLADTYRSRVTYRGEVKFVDAAQQFYFGRGPGNDLNLERKPDLGIHREVGRIYWHNGWWIGNDTDRSTLKVFDGGSETWISLAPKTKVPIPFDTATVMLQGALPEPYKIEIEFAQSLDLTSGASTINHRALNGPQTFDIRGLLTGQRRLAVVALAEPVLRSPETGFVPQSNQAVADRVFMPRKTHERHIDDVCKTLDESLRLPGLVNNSPGAKKMERYRRFALVNYCISFGIIDTSDLALLEALDSPSEQDRPKQRL